MHHTFHHPTSSHESTERPRRPVPPLRLVSLLGAGLLVAALVVTPSTGPSPDVAVAGVMPYRDAALPVAERVDDLLARMTLDEKAGQMTQAERLYVTPDDLTTYGSVRC